MKSRVFKPLKFCVNGDGNLVCPPSKVICRECMNKISHTFSEMIKEMEIKETKNGKEIT